MHADAIRFVKLTTPDITGRASAIASAQRLVTEADPAGRGELLHELLRLYAHAAEQFHSELGMVALYTAVAEVADSDQNLDRRTAAGLIIAHSQYADIPASTRIFATSAPTAQTN